MTESTPKPLCAQPPRSLRSGRPSPPRGPAGSSTYQPKGAAAGGDANQKPDHRIAFQSYFRSVGPRTYVAQVKIVTNGNHYLVLTEGQRDEKTGEVRKKRINIFSEDFDAFFNLLREAARYDRANPVPESVRRKQATIWKKRGQTRTHVRAAHTLNQRSQLPPSASHPSAQQ